MEKLLILLIIGPYNDNNSNKSDSRKDKLRTKTNDYSQQRNANSDEHWCDMNIFLKLIYSN